MKLHAPLFPIAICFIAGIAAAGVLASWTTGLALFLVSVFSTALLSRWPRWQTAGIWFCFALLGMTLGARKQQQLDVAWPQEAIEQEVIVMEEPVVKERWVVLNTWTADGAQKLRLHIERDSDS